MFQQMQKKVLKMMKLKVFKASENVFEKIAKKVITLNETIIQNLFFFYRETLFLKRQNLFIFNRFNLFFDCYQR